MAGVEGSCHVSNEALVQLAIEARNHAYVPYTVPSEHNSAAPTA